MNQGALAALLGRGCRHWNDMGCHPDELLAACRSEEVSGLLYHLLRETPEFESWPRSVRQALAHDSRAAVAQELLVRRELVRALDALGARGVRPILFKGTALAYAWYSHPGQRPRWDTDLMIRQQDADAVREVMTALGYAPPVKCDGELLFRQFELGRQDEFGVWHTLDFHWAISSQSLFAGVLTYGELLAHAAPVPALGTNGWVPGTVDALLLALLHPVMHHRNEQRLLWSYDVHVLASELDQAGFDELVARATSKHIAAVCASGLTRARDWLGTPAPPGLLEALQAVPLSDQPTASYLTSSRTWAAEAAANLRGLTGWRDRLLLLKEIALPAPGYILRAYRLDHSMLGRALLPALYLHRGVRGVFRVVTRRN